LRIVTSGLAWTGRQFGSIQTAIDSALGEAQRDVVLVTYLFAGSADLTMDGIEKCLKRGCRVRIVLNRFQAQPLEARQRLLRLHDRFDRLRLFDFNDPSGAELHAKLLIVDRSTAIVGSANVTWRGLVANHELAVLLEEAPAAESVLAAVELLLQSASVTELRDPAV
jgi:phosphatidylserine/phosphatidylglycerophosphate/cardiolipin synthase-like enzyme